MRALAGEGFDPSTLSPEIAAFYEETSGWHLELRSRWAPLAWPFGWMLKAFFAQRLDQLCLPLRRSDLAMGIDSEIVSVVNDVGEAAGSAWLRKMRTTGQTIYSGWYETVTLPQNKRPSVKVVFPLPNGSLIVFLRPDSEPGGNLSLNSPLGHFGEDGAYLLVKKPSGVWVRRAPIVERFNLYIDALGVLRTDHTVRLWNIPVMNLTYRMTRLPPVF